MKTIFECNGVACYIDIPPEASGDDWAALQNAFQSAAGFGKDRFAYVATFHPERMESAAGIPFQWELAGPHGARFELLAMPGTTPEQIAEAKAQIRRQRDAVSISVRRIDKFIPAPTVAKSATTQPATP